jgi:hypothetical protein
VELMRSCLGRPGIESLACAALSAGARMYIRAQRVRRQQTKEHGQRQPVSPVRRDVKRLVVVTSASCTRSIAVNAKDDQY